jgi:HK97 family phage major capsid protein
MTLRQLLEKRASLQTELRSLHEAAPDAALAGDAKVKWDTLTAGLDTLQSQIDRQSILDDLDRRSSSGVPLDGSGSSGAFEQLAAKVTAADVLAALLGGKDERCGRAIEVSAELARRSGVRPEGLLFSMSLSGAPPEKRVFSTTTPPGGPGSALIETTVAPGMIDRLRERIIVRSLGATVLSGLQGNLSIPRLKQDATAYWVGENQDITHSDPMTEGVPMSPKHVGAICEISRNMILQPSLDVARFIEDMLAKVIAIAFDRVALKGGGTNEPHGLLDPFSAIPVVGKGGAAISWNDVINLIGTVDGRECSGRWIGGIRDERGPGFEAEAHAENRERHGKQFHYERPDDLGRLPVGQLSGHADRQHNHQRRRGGQHASVR